MRVCTSVENVKTWHSNKVVLYLFVLDKWGVKSDAALVHPAHGCPTCGPGGHMWHSSPAECPWDQFFQKWKFTHTHRKFNPSDIILLKCLQSWLNENDCNHSLLRHQLLQYINRWCIVTFGGVTTSFISNFCISEFVTLSISELFWGQLLFQISCFW